MIENGKRKLTVLSFFILCTVGVVSKSLPPNIIFFLADDLGYNSLSSDVSPYLHSLGNKGVTLENYYSQEACTPARAALLTGRYPLSLGLQFYQQGSTQTGGLTLDETTLANVLQDNGYTTYMLGKWNLGNASPLNLPTARGFDYYLGFLDGYNFYWSKRSPDVPMYTDFLYSDSECYYAYDGDNVNQYSTFIYQDSAVASIKNHDFDKTPMFMYLAFQAVRSPFQDYDSKFPDSIPDDYLESDILSFIDKSYDVSLLYMDAFYNLLLDD